MPVRSPALLSLLSLLPLLAGFAADAAQVPPDARPASPPQPPPETAAAAPLFADVSEATLPSLLALNQPLLLQFFSPGRSPGRSRAIAGG